MAHGDALEGKWRRNWRMQWVASTLHTTSEHGISSITTADAHTSAASSRLNWRPCRFKWTRPFCRKTKSGFCACAITFQTQSNWQQCIASHKTRSENDKYTALEMFSISLLVVLERRHHKVLKWMHKRLNFIRQHYLFIYTYGYMFRPISR